MVPPMQPEATPDRRTLVVTGAVTLLGAGTLAACGSSDAATPTTTATSATTDPGSSGSATGGGSGSGSSGALVKLADVPVGGAVAANGPSGAIIVAQPSAGQVVAFSAICTHQGCKVAPAGATLNCPCHGSKFETATGKVLNGPAQADLAKVAVKVDGQDVVAG
jgi:cytochrome b6-f complex iron-sulfur subunit